MISAKHLPHQEHGEIIQALLKRHWFVFFSKGLFFLFLFLFPIVFYYLIGNELYGSYNSNTGRALFVLIISVYYLSVWLFFGASFINDFLDYWVVTNHRIISIDQFGLFARSVSELKLTRVQDVTSDVKGFFPTVLHYGNVHIQTAGTMQHFVFKQVPRADKVVRDILYIVEKYKHEHHDESITNHN